MIGSKLLRGGFLTYFGFYGALLGSALAVVELPPVPSFLTAEQKKPLEAYVKAMEENEASQEGYIAKLNEKYIGALKAGHARMLKMRAARAAKALEGEIARINAGDTSHSPEIDTAPDFVKQMRKEYEQFLGRVNSLQRSRNGEARFVVDRRLTALEVELTKADQIDKALEVRKFRRDLASPPKPPKPEKTEDDGDDEPPEPGDREDSDEEGVPLDEDVGPDTVYTGSDDIPRPMTDEENAKFAGKMGAAPQRTANGYAPLVASIKRGDVSEITLGGIKRWGAVRPQMWGGKPVWTATVTYPTKSLFGTFDTEGMAIILDGDVVEWLYTGSGEEIP